eukprot:364496-Chlamydomonas_euryale.AAC.10
MPNPTPRGLKSVCCRHGRGLPGCSSMGPMAPGEMRACSRAHSAPAASPDSNIDPGALPRSIVRRARVAPVARKPRIGAFSSRHDLVPAASQAGHTSSKSPGCVDRPFIGWRPSPYNAVPGCASAANPTQATIAVLRRPSRRVLAPSDPSAATCDSLREPQGHPVHRRVQRSPSSPLSGLTSAYTSARPRPPPRQSTARPSERVFAVRSACASGGGAGSGDSIGREGLWQAQASRDDPPDGFPSPGS